MISDDSSILLGSTMCRKVRLQVQAVARKTSRPPRATSRSRKSQHGIGTAEGE